MNNKIANIFAEAVKNIFSFLAVFFLWLGAVFMYLIKKLFRSLLYFFSRENFRKNKIKIIACLVFILAILLLSFFVFKNYKVVLIPKNEQKQSTIEKAYLKDLNKIAAKQADQKKNNINTVDNKTVRNNENNNQKSTPESKQKIFSGKIVKLEDKKIIIVKNDQEEAIILDDNTKIVPSNKKLEVNQSVTVFTRLENDKIIANRISVTHTPSTK